MTLASRSTGILVLLAVVARASAGPTGPPPRVVLVGGGPDPMHNQVGIESNVRYVSRLLQGSRQTVLFADGNPQRATVEYEKQGPAAMSGHGALAFDLLFPTAGPGMRYRRPRLPRVDGPAQKWQIASTFDTVRRELAASPRPLFLYFTGHGGPSSGMNPNDTTFELWGNGKPLRARDLALQIGSLPRAIPVYLVMVQCFSGGFGDVLFEGANPGAGVSDRIVAGFFAATADRPAAGCTDAVNEAEYHDFTSYFFAALSGHDRVGRPVTGADYNHDGMVGMDEAFAYSLVADESIDVPVSTSDVFLRHYVSGSDAELFKTPYRQVMEWASPAQQAALQGLSEKLNLHGEERLKSALDELKSDFSRFNNDAGRAMTQFKRERERWRARLLARWPVLDKADAARYPIQRRQAIAYLEAPETRAELTPLIEAGNAVSLLEEGPGMGIRQARLLRIARLGKSVILAHRLIASGKPDVVARWRRLVQAEATNPLVPVSQVAQARRNQVAARPAESVSVVPNQAPIRSPVAASKK